MARFKRNHSSLIGQSGKIAIMNRQRPSARQMPAPMATDGSWGRAEKCDGPIRRCQIGSTASPRLSRSMPTVAPAGNASAMPVSIANNSPNDVATVY